MGRFQLMLRCAKVFVFYLAANIPIQFNRYKETLNFARNIYLLIIISVLK